MANIINNSTLQVEDLGFNNFIATINFDITGEEGLEIWINASLNSNGFYTTMPVLYGEKVTLPFKESRTYNDLQIYEINSSETPPDTLQEENEIWAEIEVITENEGLVSTYYTPNAEQKVKGYTYPKAGILSLETQNNTIYLSTVCENGLNWQIQTAYIDIIGYAYSDGHEFILSSTVPFGNGTVKCAYDESFTAIDIYFYSEGEYGYTYEQHYLNGGTMDFIYTPVPKRYKSFVIKNGFIIPYKPIINNKKYNFISIK